MKKTFLYIASVFAFLSAYPRIAISSFSESDIPDNTLANQDTIDNRFIGWTDKDYQAYEDSVLAALYAPVIPQKTEAPMYDEPVDDGSSEVPSMYANTHVPTTVAIDKSKSVGEIAIQSGKTSTGAKTYSIPIQVYPGIKGLKPHLSFAYNSQQGNSYIGAGWMLSGAPMITRGGKTVYYDGKSQGILMTKDDGFSLNGSRLIKISETGTNINYQSERGNIKVKAFISGTTVKYFEVYYPDGHKGVFGYASNTTNRIFYPIISLSDLQNNKIDYTYNQDNNNYKLINITYNGASVEFQYQSTRPDPILSYCGGVKIVENTLLSKVTCKFGNTVLGTYDLTYSAQNGISVLTQIGYSASGQSFNPIKFYYGSGITATAYTKTETQLLEWYKSDDPNMIKVVKGKFDYDSGADGLISMPNLNPYWKHYRHSTAFRHSQNRFDNRYTGDEKIFLYAGLKESFASPMPNLKTEAGFVDIFCADIEGKQEEYVIKVNDLVVNNQDQVTFNVYRSNLYSGLSKKYTRTYNFPTVYTDADKGKSIQPKFYFTGDFNDDGKMEVLAVSSHQPFGDTGKPSKCYLFDLEGNRIIYQNHLFPYNVDFVGVQQTDPKAAAQNTDRLFVVDYDGDGKSDICLINEAGVHIYTFDISGSTLTGRKVSTYTGLKKADLDKRRLLVGELNGDGLLDLLVSPPSAAGGGYVWTTYNATGNGQFEKSTFSGTFNGSADTDGFLMQDINGDGMTDLIKYDASGFFTYLAKNNNVASVANRESFTSKSILIPTNLNTHSYFTQLVSLKDGKATKFAFTRNDSKESLLTGAANSYGVIEQNAYQTIDEEGVRTGTYTKGYGAIYPFVNIYEPISVLASTETYMNGKITDQNRYSYKNAVIHRQGLGFRGFETITCYNQKGQSLVQTYDPYRYSIIKSEESPEFKKTYNFATNVQSNKILKVQLTNKTEEDKLKKVTISTSYVYDTYDNPTQETATYTGGITIKKANTYSNNTSETAYLIGFLTDQTVTVTRSGSSYTERMQIPSHSNGLINSKNYYVNGSMAKNYSYLYDSHGNVTKETLKPYSSSNAQTTSYAYDSNGRIVKITNPLNLWEEFFYNDAGRLLNKKDCKGKTTTYKYDAFGREISVTNPDNTVQSIGYTWSEEGTNGLYAVTKAETGKPTEKIIYDALEREIRMSETRYNGVILKTDKLYDNYGNLQKVSLPFPGSSPSLWNTYNYDSFDRPLSITEPSGRKTTFSYNGNSVTSVEDKVSTTRTYDSQGNLQSLQDASGTVTYNLRPDGQPSSIVAPGNVTINMGYDSFGRRTSLADPSHGNTTYSYDASGNLSQETDADGKVIKYIYDSYNRVTSRSTPEFTTTYSYTTQNELSGETTNNGTSRTYNYDEFGRIKMFKESIVDGKWLQKDYTYSSGNVSTVKYTSQSGVLGTENYTFANGFLSEIKLNGQTTIYKLSKENNRGQISEVTSGSIIRNYTYNDYGFPTAVSAQISNNKFQNFGYTFEATTSNLTNRKDMARNLSESFGYDNLNRLTSFGGKTVSYDVKGNITSKTDAGTFAYANTQKPYAVSEVTVAGNNIPTRLQNITYNSFKRPNTISENGYTAAFTYNSQYDRVKMHLTQNGSRTLTRYYMGSCYELDETSAGKKEKLYLGGDYYTAGTVIIKENSNSSQTYFIYRDYLGSITHITNVSGTVVQEISYDAWGRMRNPVNQTVYSTDQEPALLLGRGFSGHEYIREFGLVNMNARLYDPVLGRFLSPDPFIQVPDMSQNFNRYAYGMNNPLRYVDKDGEFLHLIIGAIIGGIVNLAANWNNCNGFAQYFTAFIVGAGAGAVTAATAGAGAGVWAVAGVSAAGGSLVAGTNSVIAQTGTNFSGMGSVDWGQVGTNSLVGGVAGFAGSAAGSAVANASFVVNGISSPILRSAVVSPTAAGAAHVAGGTTAGLIQGESLGDAFTGSFSGIGESMSTGLALGVATTAGTCVSQKIDPFTGKSLKPAKPMQVHHFATDKNKTFTPEMDKIAGQYNLDLNGDWNKQALPHLGRHPNAYHQWVLDQMRIINAMPNMNQQNFIIQFDLMVKQPVIKNPDMLYKAYWQQ